MLPLVSVIVPNYNHAKFLCKRLESIFNQTYENIEILLFDDCSQDNSQEILKKFSNHPKVTITLFNESNSGAVINQWIKGLSYCKGEYVWIAESDDFSDKTFIETTIEPMLSDREIVLSYVDSNVIDENDNIIYKINYSHEEFSGEQWENSFIINGKQIIKENLIFRNVIPNVSSALFTTTVLKACVNYGKGFKKVSDWIVYFYVLLQGKICFQRQALNYFREHDNTTRAYSKTNLSLAAEEALVVRRIISNKLNLHNNKIAFQNSKTSNYQTFNDGDYSRLFEFITKDIILVITPYNNYTRFFLENLDKDKLKAIKEILDIKGKFLAMNHNGIPVVSIENSNWLSECQQVIIFSDNYCDEIRRNILDSLDGRNIVIKTIGDIYKDTYK